MSLAVKVARANSQGGIPVGVTVRSGDPGLFGFLGGIAKRAVGLIPGVGPIASAALSTFGGGRPQQVAPPRLNLPLIGQRGAGFSVGEVSTNGAAPKGTHLNKSDYFLRDGTFVAKGTRLVRNRRRDPMNARALRRAISRVDAGKVWQGKLSEITTAKFTSGGKRKDKC